VRTGERNSDARKALEGFVEFAIDEVGSRGTAIAALLRVMRAAKSIVVSDASAAISCWRPSQVEMFRSEAIELLKALVSDSRADRGSKLQAIQIRNLELSPAPAGNTVALILDGPARDVLWFQVLDVLRTVGIENIRPCRFCERIFVKSGKRDYCSSKCAQNFRARAFYTANRDVVLERRHRRYVNRVRRGQPKPVGKRRRRA
jgi:hypothetical protein